MEGLSEKCKIEHNDTLGRYVIAVSDLKAGETVLKEGPVLVTSTDGERRCSNCFRLTESFCSTCHVFPLCDVCNQHNEFDCKTIAQMQNLCIERLRKNIEICGVLKCLLLRENVETKSFYDELMQLESHQEQRRNSNIWMENEEKIIKPILDSGLVENLHHEGHAAIDEEFLQNICGIMDVNSFEIRAPDRNSMRAIYMNCDILAHSCVANTLITIDDQYQMKVYANRDIKAGELLYNCYTNPLLGTDERREILKIGKYFHCECDRCKDPTELGSYMSSLLCRTCTGLGKEGFIIKMKDHWQCENCGHKVESTKVESIVERVKEESFLAKDDIRRMELLIAKLSGFLHQNHYLIVDLKQNVAAILRTIIMSPAHRPGRKVYERKVILCKDILVVLRIVQPGISRLKAIALYELSNSFAELSRLRFEEKEISEEELIELLLQVEAMLRESLRMLIYEPVNTPEGQLTRSMLKELKDLQNDIKVVKIQANEKYLK